jgi:hypothetical protein
MCVVQYSTALVLSIPKNPASECVYAHRGNPYSHRDHIAYFGNASAISVLRKKDVLAARCVRYLVERKK